MKRGVLREGFAVILLFIWTPLGLQDSTPDKSRKVLYINSVTKSWKDASRSCSLVGSDRSPSYDVNAQEIPVLGSSYRGGRPQAGTFYWIGAAANFTPWFELLGCQVIVPSQTVSTLTNLSLVIGPVADCYKQCNNHFGVNETHCYCTSALKGSFTNYSCGLSRFPYFKTRTDVIGENNTERDFYFYYQFAMYKVLDNFKLTTEDTLDECLINSTTAGEMTTSPCDAADSSSETWIDSVLRGLPLKEPGPGQWTTYTRRRLVRWTADSITSASTMTSPSIGTEPRDRMDTTAKVDAIATTAMISRDLTPTLLPKNENDPITSASTTTSPSIGTEKRDRTDTKAKVDAIATTAMIARDLTPTLLPKNENDPITSASTTTSPPIVDAIATTAMISRNLTPTLLPKNKYDPITSASTTTSPSIGTEPRDRTDTTAKVDAISTTTMMSRDATPTLLPKNESEASVPPVIAGSVAAGCIFVLVIAITIILRVKRRPNSKQQSVSAGTENVYYSGLADEHTPLQGITPSSADDRMTDKTSPDSSERGQLAQRDEDGVYNHTWDKPITEQQTDHVYSSTDTGNEYDCVNSDVYNHTWDKPITEEITDHVYSSTSSEHHANVYDHTDSRN